MQERAPAPYAPVSLEARKGAATLVTAYLLIKIQGGTKIKSMEHVTTHSQVKKMTWALGPYDAIIECELPSMDERGAFARVVRACPGVAESVT